MRDTGIDSTPSKLSGPTASPAIRTYAPFRTSAVKTGLLAPLHLTEHDTRGSSRVNSVTCKQHKVAQRESVESIAYAANHIWPTVWDRAQNKVLRERRNSPPAQGTHEGWVESLAKYNGERPPPTAVARFVLQLADKLIIEGQPDAAGSARIEGSRKARSSSPTPTPIYVWTTGAWPEQAGGERR